MKDLKKSLGPILPAIASIGVVLTTGLAVKATPKAMVLLEEDRKTKDDTEEYTKKDAVKAVWKCYIPTACVGAATIFCIFGTSSINKHNQEALASAYILVSESYDKYKAKVKELYGDDVHNNVVQSVLKEECKDVHIHSVGLIKDISSEFTSEFEPEPIHTFYDRFSNRYFDSTLSMVLQAEYHLNRNFCLNGGYITLNEFYDFIGLEPTIPGDVIGWEASSGIGWIDFDHSVTTIEDGSEEGCQIYIIDMVFSPEPLDEY